jgi:hypothetical protein
VQDRDGAVPLLKASRRRFPFVKLGFADTAYAAERVRKATSIAIQIVRKIPNQVRARSPLITYWIPDFIQSSEAAMAIPAA